MVLLPVLLLGAVELTLRLVGYGHPTSFFVPLRMDGRNFFVPNDKFSFRFFPQTMARVPTPLRIAADKPTNSYRIFLFGESAAWGDPEPAFGVARFVEVLLRERFPGTDFQVVSVAITAINSHVILPIARECAGHQGDLWLIYMGNNEMVGPFGASTIFGPPSPPTAFVRASLAAKATRTGQLMDDSVARLRGDSSVSKSWGGMKMFQGHQLRYDDPARLRTYVNFDKNLEDILTAGINAGVPIILSTVGSNLRDCAPFASLHRSDLDPSQKASWEEHFQNGSARESAGSYQEALEFYLKAAAIDPQFAELQFRLGRCHLALTNEAQAGRDFELARDYDTLAFRADTRINQAIKDAATHCASKGVYLLDAAAVMAQSSPHGISGHATFYEHVHLNFEGNYLLARGFAEEAAKHFPAGIAARSKGDWASAEVCNRRLAVTGWDRYRVWQQIISRMFEPPFTDQSDHDAAIKFCAAKVEEIKSQMTADAPKQALATYQEEVRLAPEDHFLHENFAVFLEATGDLAGAVKQTQLASELLPERPVTDFYIGSLLVRLGRTTEAAESFSRALALRNDFVPALNEMGLIRANQQKPVEAAAFFARALKLNPADPQTQLNLGFLEQIDGRPVEALAHYQEAARLEPQGAPASFSQACALISQHKRTEAIEYLQNAIRLNPRFWQARYELGVEWASLDKIDDAQAEFSEVIRFRPDYARAHSNLGVTLARQGKTQQAITELRAALQLNPGDKAARQNLESLQAAKNTGP
ncbi:MAG: hypothetical protein JWR26_4217 [Pedosphaera sp.]|nr:hypothetical protein [Pedosphaera sp.]